MILGRLTRNRRRVALSMTVAALAAGATVGGTATLAGSGSAAVAGPAKAQVQATTFGEAVLAGINAERRRHRLQPLRMSGQLVRSAARHARSMARTGYFSHSSPDGTPASARIRRYYRGSTVGEAMLWRSPGITPAQAVQMWLASPPHRAILLQARFREVGIASARIGRAVGSFSAGPSTVVVADFGAR